VLGLTRHLGCTNPTSSVVTAVDAHTNPNEFNDLQFHRQHRGSWHAACYISLERNANAHQPNLTSRRTDMKSNLTINDLPVVEELDQKAMAAVVGGNKIVDKVIDVATVAWGLLTGQCEVSNTGKSIVCY
jgi:hypothetical protein